MAGSTPEGAVKRKINGILERAKSVHGELWFFMPVQNGMGKASLDYIGWFRGRAFAIEAKRPGALPTPRQLLTMSDMSIAGAKVFTIDGSELSLGILTAWLELAAP